MIRNKRKTNKFVSALSVVLAVVMLGTTVFASGVLSDLTTDDYTIEITNNGEKIEFANKPFIENGEVYVPLRETMEKAGFNQNNSNIVWDNGKIYITIAQNGTAGLYGIELGQAYMGLKHIQPSEIYNTSFNTAEPIMSIGMHNVPILRNSNTYIPIKDINYMLYGFFNVRNEDNSLHELNYNIYDKNGNEISIEPFSNEEIAAARAVVEEYFKAANEKGKRGELKTLTEWHRAPNVILTSDIDAILTLKDIRYNPNDTEREMYIKYGHGSVTNTPLDNVIVFRVDYNVSAINGGDIGAYNEGDYNDWNMILIRDSKDGHWLIDDMGY